MYDCIVIGAGPAGMSAAIYLKRSNNSVIMIEKTVFGGQMNRTAHIENYPGYEKIDGPTLAATMFVQTQNLSIPYINEEVISVEKMKNVFIVKTNINTYKSKTVILATGRSPKALGLENEDFLIGRGISYCAICDGPLFRNKDVAVVGGGNSAFEEALYLAGIVNKVYLVHRNTNFRAEQSLIDKVYSTNNIEVITNNVVTKLNKNEDILKNIEINNVLTNETRILNISGAFIYIGNNPETNIIKLELSNGYYKTNTRMQTKKAGIYAIGDVRDKKYFQITTAVSDGTIAALEVSNYLKINS